MPLLDQAMIPPFGGDLLAEKLPRLPDREVADVDDLLDLAARLAEDLAVLEADQPRQLLLAGTEPVAEPSYDLASLRGGHLPPLEEGIVGRCDRVPAVLGARRPHVRQHLSR